MFIIVLTAFTHLPNCGVAIMWNVYANFIDFDEFCIYVLFHMYH